MAEVRSQYKKTAYCLLIRHPLTNVSSCGASRCLTCVMKRPFASAGSWMFGGSYLTTMSGSRRIPSFRTAVFPPRNFPGRCMPLTVLPTRFSSFPHTPSTASANWSCPTSTTKASRANLQKRRCLFPSSISSAEDSRVGGSGSGSSGGSCSASSGGSSGVSCFISSGGSSDVLCTLGSVSEEWESIGESEAGA